MTDQFMPQEEMRTFSTNSSEVVLENVTKIFKQPDTGKDFVAVNDLSLHIASGEMVTLLGPSGCGKTTTLRMIAGFEYPTSGKISIGNRDMTVVPPNKRNISMVFQSYALFPHMTIRDNVAYGLKIKKMSKEEIEKKTTQVMKLMHLDGLGNRYPNQLSGGQQQRVALARAVVIEPGVLLFDEPLSNLDAKLRETMREELRLLQQRLGITSLYVTHDQSEAMAISDRVVIMKDGLLMQVGSPKEIYEYPQSTFIANFIGKANFIPARYAGKGPQGEGAEVRIGEHNLVLPTPGRLNFEPGEEIFISARPESMHLSSQAEGGLPVTIKRSIYFGSNVEYHITMDDKEQDIFVVSVYNPQLTEHFEAGAQVYLHLDIACLRLLHRERELKGIKIKDAE